MSRLDYMHGDLFFSELSGEVNYLYVILNKKHARIVDGRKAVHTDYEGGKSTGSKDHLILPSIVLGEPQRKQMVLVLLKLIKRWGGKKNKHKCSSERMKQRSTNNLSL